jgi:PrtD family type I secretion system ABC transporter
MQQIFHIVKRPVGVIALLSVTLNLLLLAPTLFMMQVFDRVLTSHREETLAVLALGTGIALLMSLAFDYLRARMQGITGQLVGELLLPPVVRATIEQDAHAASQPPTNATRDVNLIRQVFSAQGLLALLDAPWLIVYVATITCIHPLLGATAAVSAAIMLGLAVLNDRITRRQIAQLQDSASSAHRFLEHSLGKGETLRSLGMTSAMLERWAARNEVASAALQPTAARSVCMAAGSRLVRQLAQTLMLSLGAYLVITQRATPGIMIAATVIIGRALAPVEQIVGSWRLLAEGGDALRRLGALLAKTEVRCAPMPLPAPTGELGVALASFRLPGSDRLLLEGVSFQLRPGESMAIIGPSAAGKSTLLRLLIGLRQPSTGAVTLDGADIARWPREHLSPWIGYVPQEVDLFAGTVAENIARLGQVDPERVVEAAKRARVHDLILSLPGGYDTELDEGARLLSPGQRQRIALARALYGDVRLLVMDEPNANLDGAGEQALADVMRDLHGKVTVVVVTHRSTLIEHVDQIAVLEGGRIRHKGPREEVLRRMQGRPATVVTLPPRAGGPRESARSDASVTAGLHP